MLQKALDDRAVDYLELDAGELKPDQEVTSGIPVLGELALGSSTSMAKIVDELKNDWVEAVQCCGPQQSTGGWVSKTFFVVLQRRSSSD